MEDYKKIKKKAVKGVLWVAIEKYSIMAVHFISGIILARLLTPHDYGCIGMLSIFMVVARSIIDSGFGSALIQKKRPTQEDYSTIFYWNMGTAFIMYVLLFIASPYIAAFYRLPEISNLLRVQGLLLFITALNIVQANQLRKTFKFKIIALATILASVLSFMVGVLMAYSGYGVWSLVALNMVSAVVPMLIYWLTCKWRPILVFSVRSFKELFSFGFFMFLTNIINNISNNIQGLLIGRFYTPTTMGYYAKANSIESLASHGISSVLTQVTYPLYAEAQDDKKVLVNAIKKITMSLAYITFPMMFLLIMLATPLFIVLYSERWLPSVPYFQLLCVAGLAACLQAVNAQSIAAIGKSKVMFGWTIAKRVSGILFILGGFWLFGIWGLLSGMVISAWIIYIINAALVSHYIGYKLHRQLLDLLPSLLLSIVSFAISYIVGQFVESIYLSAIIQFLVFVLFYFSGSIMLKLQSYIICKNTLLIFYGRKNRP